MSEITNTVVVSPGRSNDVSDLDSRSSSGKYGHVSRLRTHERRGAPFLGTESARRFRERPRGRTLSRIAAALVASLLLLTLGSVTVSAPHLDPTSPASGSFSGFGVPAVTGTRAVRAMQVPPAFPAFHEVLRALAHADDRQRDHAKRPTAVVCRALDRRAQLRRWRRAMMPPSRIEPSPVA